jgi:hypothetical protein
MALQHLRSSTADKRPTPGAMSDGQLAMNTNLVSPGLFLKDSNGDLVKVGPVHVGTTAPNATPGAGGQAGNSKGEQWLDTSSSRYVFKIWDGTAWRTEDGEFVNVSGDTMTGALGIIAGTAAAPGVFFSGDTNTGIYSPGADQVAISTNGVERVAFGTSEVVFNDGGANYDFRIEGDTNANLFFVDASAEAVGIGTTSPGVALHVDGDIRCDGVYGETDTNTSIQFPGSNVITFNEGGSEAARIDSSGRLLVGTSTAVLSSKFLSQYDGGIDNGAVLNETANTASTTFLAFALSGTIIGSVVRVGATSAVVYNTTSDYRLKAVVGPVTGQGERIDNLKPIDFQWKESGEQSRGFLAHEFQTVYANSVTGEKDAVDADGKPIYQAMQASTSEIIADLVAEIQQLRTRIAALEAC